MRLLKYFNKKGISTDVLVIVLLIIGLAVAVIVIISLMSSGKGSQNSLFNLTQPLKNASGL